MAEKIRLLKDNATFNAPTELISLFSGRFISKITIGLYGETSAAASLPGKNLKDAINTFKVFKMGSPIIDLTGEEIIALNALYLGKSPSIVDSGTTAGNPANLMGLEVPIYLMVKALGEAQVQVGFASVSGAQNIKITLAEHSLDTALPVGYFHCVRIPGMTSGATGYGNRIELSGVGDLKAIMFYSSSIPTVTSDATTVQKVRIIVNGVEFVESNWKELQANKKNEVTTGITDNYGIITFDEPIPKGASVTVDIFGGVASSSFAVYPIYEVKE